MADYRLQIVKEISESLQKIDPLQINNMVSRIHQSKQIFCDGLGRSSLAIRGFAMRLMQLGYQSRMVGETTTPALCQNDLLLICTASGTSPVLLYHAQQAIANGGSVALITANATSPIAYLAEDIILIATSNKDSDKAQITSVQPMGSLFEQTSQLLCDTMSLQLMQEYSVTGDDMRRRHTNIE